MLTILAPEKNSMLTYLRMKLKTLQNTSQTHFFSLLLCHFSSLSHSLSPSPDCCPIGCLCHGIFIEPFVILSPKRKKCPRMETKSKKEEWKRRREEKKERKKERRECNDLTKITSTSSGHQRVDSSKVDTRHSLSPLHSPFHRHTLSSSISFFSLFSPFLLSNFPLFLPSVVRNRFLDPSLFMVTFFPFFQNMSLFLFLFSSHSFFRILFLLLGV